MKEKELKDIQFEVEKIKADKRKYYEFERFNVDYLASVNKLFKTSDRDTKVGIQ